MYNAESYIEQCIQSVLNQEEKDFEIVIVNDESEDSSKKIVENHLKNSKIRLINQKNSGSFHTRCRLINEAKGDYAIFLDADDTLKKNALSKIKEEINHSNFDIIIYRAESVYQNGEKYEFNKLFSNGRIFTNDKKELYEALLKGTNGIHVMWIKAIKLKCFDKNIGKDAPRISVSDDLYFSLRPITNANSIKYIDDILYEYKIHKDSLMSNFQPNVYDGISFVYAELRKYLDEWEMNTIQDLNLFYQKYIAAVSGIILYSRASLKNRKKEYIRTLEDIKQDDFFNEIYSKAFTIAPFKYKIPLFLVKNKLNNISFVLNIAITKLRGLLKK